MTVKMPSTDRADATSATESDTMYANLRKDVAEWNDERRAGKDAPSIAQQPRRKPAPSPAVKPTAAGPAGAGPAKAGSAAAGSPAAGPKAPYQMSYSGMS